jgi:glucosamine-6-phosphate deaminase
MHIHISSSKSEAGKRAAQKGADAIGAAIQARGEASIILATGASQFEVLDALVDIPGTDWSCTTIFHLDEYIGIEATHSASFIRYLQERFLARVPAVKDFVAINGNAANIDLEIQRISSITSKFNIDVAFVGIGENGHLAFNDPPADFDTDAPFIRVELDKKCRTQQSNEGWFPTFEDVPSQAISMSIKQITKSSTIICTVPDERKAQAVKAALEGEITNLCPASVLQTHANTFFFLDTAAAKLLRKTAG